MNLLFAAIGTIIGALIFVIADYRVLVTTFVCFFLSSLAFTSMTRYKAVILSLFTFILLMFFNYNFRAEYLQYLDPNKVYKSSEIQYLKIETPANQNDFFQDEFIVSLKKRDPSFLDRVKDIFIPYRFLLVIKSGKGFQQGDVINLGEVNPEFKALTGFKAKVLKKEKVFFKIKAKGLERKINFEKHELDVFSDTRQQIKRYFLKTLGQEQGLITTSLLFGSRVAKIPDEVMLGIKRLGLSHIFAASGFHLMLLAGFLQFIFTRLRLNSRLESLLIITLSIIYTGLAGFSPSIVRSAVCITAFYLAKLANRKINNLKLLTILAGIVIFIDPYSILDLGLQLSYLATLAILIWGSPINQKLEEDFKDGNLSSLNLNQPAPVGFINIYKAKAYQFFLHYTRESIALSLAVQTLIAPLTLYYFKSFPVWSILANLIFTPLLSAVIVLAVFGMSFIINPILGFSLYLFKLSEYLPWVNYQIEFSFTSMVLLLIILNLSAFLYCNKEFLKSTILRSSILTSLVILLLSKTLPVYGIQEFYVRYGHFDSFIEKEIHEMKKNKDNYRYFTKAGLEGLIILDTSSLKKLKSLDGKLREVQMLVLPSLKTNSIYLETLTKVLKPQFVLISSKSKSKKIENAENRLVPRSLEANLKHLRENSNVLLNEGKLVVSDKKYWRIYN
ncbi:MAG: ComEC/Rec2 family competence protein [Candidatus Melainabacteria bacterium]|nr:ComEC/Rec2 family competence protein [Candidatus Melainabacteria bacterium]